MYMYSYKETSLWIYFNDVINSLISGYLLKNVAKVADL